MFSSVCWFLVAGVPVKMIVVLLIRLTRLLRSLGTCWRFHGCQLWILKRGGSSGNIEESTISTMSPALTSSFADLVCCVNPCVAGTRSTAACCAGRAANRNRKIGTSS